MNLWSRRKDAEMLCVLHPWDETRSKSVLYCVSKRYTPRPADALLISTTHARHCTVCDRVMEQHEYVGVQCNTRSPMCPNMSARVGSCLLQRPSSSLATDIIITTNSNKIHRPPEQPNCCFTTSSNSHHDICAPLLSQLHLERRHIRQDTPLSKLPIPSSLLSPYPQQSRGNMLTLVLLCQTTKSSSAPAEMGIWGASKFARWSTSVLTRASWGAMSTRRKPWPSSSPLCAEGRVSWVMEALMFETLMGCAWLWTIVQKSSEGLISLCQFSSILDALMGI